MSRRTRTLLGSVAIFSGFLALSLVVRVLTAKEERLPQTVRVLSRTEVGPNRFLVRLAPEDDAEPLAVEAVTQYPFGFSIVEAGGPGAPGRPTPLAVPVRTARVGPGDVERRVVAFGTVEATRDARVSVEAAGVVQEVRFALGTLVAAGAPLLELDPRDAQLRVRRAEGELARARAAAARATEAEASLVAQKETMLATLAVRERDLERWRSLAARDLASGDRADQADTQWRAAVAEAQRLDGAHKEATAALAEASAAVTLAEVEQDAARLGLERCTLRAPFAGVVAERLVQPGQWLAAGAVALRLVSTDQVRVRVHVREEDALAVAAGAKAELSLPGVHPLPAGDGSPSLSDGAGPFPGVIEGVAGAADARTRTFAVDVVAPGSDVLRPGLFARVVLHGALLHEAVLVPDAAVVADEAGETYFVFVVEGDRARRVAVTLGPRQGEGRLLRGGLGAQPVELVVGGTSLLFDGAPIARLPQ